MSVVELDRPYVGSDIISRPPLAPRGIPREEVRPKVRIEADIRPKAKARPKASLAASLGFRTFMFAALFGGTYIASSLSGQVLVEHARRAEISAKERAQEARRAEASLRTRVDALTSGEAIEAWAGQHGFGLPQVAMQKHEG